MPIVVSADSKVSNNAPILELFNAIDKSDAPEVEKLLKEGLNPDSRDENGKNGLERVLGDKHVAGPSQLTIVRSFVKYGITIENLDQKVNGETSDHDRSKIISTIRVGALLTALKALKTEEFTQLMAPNNAYKEAWSTDFDFADKDGETLLSLAFKYRGSHPEFIRVISKVYKAGGCHAEYDITTAAGLLSSVAVQAVAINSSSPTSNTAKALLKQGVNPAEALELVGQKVSALQRLTIRYLTAMQSLQRDAVSGKTLIGSSGVVTKGDSKANVAETMTSSASASTDVTQKLLKPH